LNLLFDKAPIKKGDVVVGKTFAPESSLARGNVNINNAPREETSRQDGERVGGSETGRGNGSDWE